MAFKALTLTPGAKRKKWYFRPFAFLGHHLQNFLSDISQSIEKSAPFPTTTNRSACCLCSRPSSSQAPPTPA